MKNLSQIIDNRLTDKNTRHSYIETYQKFFDPIRFSTKKVLEIGVQNGGGLKMLHDFFENATVTGIEIKNLHNLSFLTKLERVNLLFENAYDLDFINSNFKSNEFDILLDDGPHTFDSQLFFLNHYSKLANKNGLVIVEDVEGIANANALIEQTSSNLDYQIIDLRHERTKKAGDNILVIGKANE